MVHLFRLMGIFITLTLVLALFVNPAQASETSSVSAVTGEQPEDTGLVCLALVGGVAILAGGMLMGMMRRMMP
ncbi:MAG: hypothetical protein GY832_12710 [Chloroflexi bacterium]|nr:hypothetical protein [Chloroflexota bacterium]